MPPMFMRCILLICLAIAYTGESTSFGQTTFPDGTLVKGTGPEVDVIHDGQRRWVPDPATLEILFGVDGWAQVHKLSDAEFNAIPKGPQLPSEVLPGVLVKGLDSAQVYVINHLGARNLIPDPETFYDYDFVWSKLKEISQGSVNAIPLGAPLPHSARFEFSGGGRLPRYVSRNMETSGNFSTKTRLLTATTHTWETTALAGFKGGVSVIFADNHGLILTQAVREFGVDGTWIGRSDRTDTWQESIDQNTADHTVSVYVIHGPDPQDIRAAVDNAIAIAKPIGDAIAGWAPKLISSGPAEPKTRP
jgi:hypothetical protein